MPRTAEQRKRISEGTRNAMRRQDVRKKVREGPKKWLQSKKNRELISKLTKESMTVDVKKKISIRTRAAMKKVPREKLAYWKGRVSTKLGKTYKRGPTRLEKLESLAGRKRPSKCDACGKQEKAKNKTLAFDHSHVTNKFRGWICMSCNLMLGHCNDDIAHLKKLLAYLTKHV